jgi:hypothetical protein
VTYEYKCVAGPTIVAVKSAKARDQAVKAFEEIMNAEASLGWEYVGIDEFHISEPMGLFNRKRVYVPAKILVFRRAKAGSAPAMASPAMTTPAITTPAMTTPAEPQAALPPPSQPLTATRADGFEDSPPSIKAIADSIKAGKAG